MSLESTQAQPNLSMATPHLTGERRLPFLAQVGLLAGRTIQVNLRVPAAVLPSLLISFLTLFVYKAQFSGIAQVFLHGKSYVGFILPLTLLSAALSGSSVAGQTILRDIERGYFDKLSLTPINRWALLLGPMLAGGAFLAAQTVILLSLGLLLGLRPVTGFAGLLVVLGLTLLLGVGFSGLTVGIALLTGNSAATASANFLFFPLTFLTATFVPLDQLEGWIQVVARINPITPILEATRSLFNDGWDGALISRALFAGGALTVIIFAFALYGLQTRTRRR